MSNLFGNPDYYGGTVINATTATASIDDVLKCFKKLQNMPPIQRRFDYEVLVSQMMPEGVIFLQGTTDSFIVNLKTMKATRIENPTVWVQPKEEVKP